MYFKGIISVAFLALLGISNAAPYNSGTKTVSRYSSSTNTLPLKAPEFNESKTKTIQDSGNSTKIVPTNFYIEKCTEKSGIPIILANDQMFTNTCLIKYTESDKNSKINPKNSACFYSKDTILCIDSELTNIDYCDKSNEVFNYDMCLRTVHNLSVMANVTEENELDRPLLTYPDKERLVITPIEDKNDCQKNNGIIFSHQTIYQYLCFYPEKKIKNIKETHCATIDGKKYCVEENLSSIGTCKKSNKSYNSEECNNLLKTIGKNNDKKIEL